MTLYSFNPLENSRWNRFVENHPGGSIFHASAWIKALWDTYGYRPVVYTTASPDSELTDAILLCEVRSSLTGNRLVSLPFSDHCALLADIEKIDEVFAELYGIVSGSDNKYIEIRSGEGLD